MDGNVPKTGKAIVYHGPVNKGQWKLEEVQVRDLKDDELLVEMVASGICHTDLAFADREADGKDPTIFYPRVMGHEGSAYVRAVGSAVTVAQPGDPVLLSFNSCGTCGLCSAHFPSHCTSFNPLNFFRHDTFSTANSDASKPTIAGSCFGQSSFASLSIASQRSVVNVKDHVKSMSELQRMAPLGCGIQTGAGTVINVAEASTNDTIAVTGMGGVGLSAIMAAKIQQCRTIIAIDRISSRLELARELGATHAIDTSSMKDIEAELPKAVQDITEDLGAHIVIDTTGFMPIVRACLSAARFRGKIIQVGTTPMEAKLELPVWAFMVTGKQYIGAIEGQVTPSVFIPKMLEWNEEGKFPYEKFMKTFAIGEKGEGFEHAIEGMHKGEVIKPIIVWKDS